MTTSSGFIPASVVVLAIGHSARDTYRMLAERGVPMTPKPFQFGVRIEHPQELVNAVQYGPRHAHYEELLGNADYSLVAQRRARPVHLLHVRRRVHHPERVAGRVTSAPTA